MYGWYIWIDLYRISETNTVRRDNSILDISCQWKHFVKIPAISGFSFLVFFS